MAKINANYEALYILDPALGEEEITALVEKFKGVVGYYVLMTFNAAAAIPHELDRLFRINDSVMRSLIVCKDQ